MFKKLLSFNRVVLVLVIVEFFLNSALQTIAPFLAIFVIDQIEGGTAFVAGLAVAVYWLTKSAFQLPIARWLDKTDGERDEFWALFLGYLAVSFVPLFYFFAVSPWHLYAAQAFFGFVMAWAVPAFYSIFTRHADKADISFEWSLFSVFSIGVSSGVSAVVGGILIDNFGFGVIFVIASFAIFASAMSILFIKKHLTVKKTPSSTSLKQKMFKHYYRRKQSSAHH